jgi:hypothetical protein
MDAVHQIGPHSLYRPGQFDVRQPGQHLWNDRGGFHSREVRAQADVHPAASEREMWVRCATDVEAVSIVALSRETAKTSS